MFEQSEALRFRLSARLRQTRNTFSQMQHLACMPGLVLFLTLGV
jgi:hypothetical protein